MCVGEGGQEEEVCVGEGGQEEEVEVCVCVCEGGQEEEVCVGEGGQEEEVERVYVWREGTYVNVRVWVCGCDMIFHWFIFVIFPPEEGGR